MIDPNFWSGKKVLLTGHTGFKGSWLALWLDSMGAKVKGLALEPPSSPSMFEELKIAENIESEICDIRDFEAVLSSVESFSPAIVIHMAAQPLVRLSYSQPIETYHTNVMGTVHVLEAIRKVGGVKAVINVTSDKCYENKEWPWGYREDEPKGGYDPYSNSKGCAELVADSYRNSFFNKNKYKDHGCALASVRAGNVIGGGDWADDRLIPDILSSFEAGKSVHIRSPHSIRPWQHVLEPLSGYLLTAQLLFEQGPCFAEGWNFGPNDTDAKPVNWIVDRLTSLWGEGANWQLDGDNHPHEAGYLKLDCSKAKMRMEWQPRWNLDETLERIVAWHKAWLAKEDMKAYTLEEIKQYIASAY
ncbi:CDP-glucose 4,6-dehydratase [Agaribacterium sp. ZY112]|uniref:CDP-glucose 4,6-dehydratase n=1 Tax=Agaribacterium sp. ZY112 TaxID=3233574 RepID=UPI00352667F4